MNNITSVILSKYQNHQKYENIGNGIYKDLENKRYVITLHFELEENDDYQYPLEDVLDKFLVNCTDYIVEKLEGGTRILEVEIEDGNDEEFESLEKIQKIASLCGKRVYNKEDGEYVKLVIE